jgi:hypothetical protein
MDLIDRYIYAVTKSLPVKQRMDIDKELRTLIEDMIEQDQNEGTYESKVQKVLMELGDPEVLADNYRGSKRYLIGPQYYEKYILILKIVFGAVFIGVSIAVFIGSVFSGQKDFGNIVVDYLGTVVNGLLQAFAWTTLAFVLAERNSMNMIKEVKEKNEWTLSQLPAIPEKKAIIPLSEPIVSIIFTTIFTAILYSVPQLFSVYISNANGTTIIPVFDLDVMRGYRALLIGIFVLSVCKDVLKLFGRRWTLKLSVAVVILVAASSVLVLIMLTNSSIWNAGFASEVMKQMNLNFDFVHVWSRLITAFIIVFVLGSAIDIVSTLYKGIKYN